MCKLQAQDFRDIKKIKIHVKKSNIVLKNNRTDNPRDEYFNSMQILFLKLKEKHRN
jgi:hypothetical protein